MEDNFDKNLDRIERELEKDETKLDHLKEEVAKEVVIEEKHISELREEIKELKNEHHSEHHHGHHEQLKLIFIVNSSPKEITTNVKWQLKTAVELAIKETGNEGRPLQDWEVKWKHETLILEKQIEEFHFPECAEIFVSLKAGQGG